MTEKLRGMHDGDTQGKVVEAARAGYDTIHTDREINGLPRTLSAGMGDAQSIPRIPVPGAVNVKDLLKSVSDGAALPYNEEIMKEAFEGTPEGRRVIAFLTRLSQRMSA